MEYKIDMTRFNEVRKRILIRTTVAGLLACIAGITISVFARPGDSSNVVNVLPYIIPVIICSFAFGTYKGIRRQRESMQSYRLNITSNTVTRLLNDTPVNSLYFAEITAIAGSTAGGYVISGKHPGDQILIPATVENIAALEAELSSIVPITAAPPSTLLQRYPQLQSMVMLGMMVGVFVSSNKIVVGITGTIFIAFFIRAFLTVVRNKNIDASTKRKMRYILLPVGAAIVKMIVIFAGYKY